MAAVKPHDSRVYSLRFVYMLKRSPFVPQWAFGMTLCRQMCCPEKETTTWTREPNWRRTNAREMIIQFGSFFRAFACCSFLLHLYFWLHYRILSGEDNRRVLVARHSLVVGISVVYNVVIWIASCLLWSMPSTFRLALVYCEWQNCPHWNCVVW